MFTSSENAGPTPAPGCWAATGATADGSDLVVSYRLHDCSGKKKGRHRDAQLRRNHDGKRKRGQRGHTLNDPVPGSTVA